jgi:hypothetical protein
VPAPKVASTAPFVLTIAADGKSATIRFPNRDPIPTRILAMGGDSVGPTGIAADIRYDLLIVE